MESRCRTTYNDVLKPMHAYIHSLAVLFDNNGNSYAIRMQSDMYMYIYSQCGDAGRVKAIKKMWTAVNGARKGNVSGTRAISSSALPQILRTYRLILTKIPFPPSNITCGRYCKQFNTEMKQVRKCYQNVTFLAPSLLYVARF